MSEELTYQYRCDRTVRRGRKYQKCDKPLSEAGPTPFTFDGTSYVVDLCDGCKKAVLLDELAALLKIAHAESARVKGKLRKALAILPSGQAVTGSDVRVWAQENDVPCSVTGRIKQEVYDQYYEYHGITS